MGSVQTLVQTPEFVIEEFPYNIDSSIRNISLNSSSKSSTTTDYVISMTKYSTVCIISCCVRSCIILSYKLLACIGIIVSAPLYEMRQSP